MNYKPEPSDTSRVTLTEDILRLTEKLARNTHEVWARQRISDGWRYGPVRDDARKQHPGLVPYEELSEAEKQYDRTTALETLKAILLMGYRLESTSLEGAGAVDDTNTADKELAALRPTLDNLDALDLASLFTLWQSHNPEQWSGSPEIYTSLGDSILKSGEPLLAHDVLLEGLKHWPTNVRLRQLQALALARSGATKRANTILRQLHDEGHTDEETLGLLARTHKDLWERSADPEERERQLRLSYEVYTEAYRLSGGYWTGINAATMALLLGEREKAEALAGEVRAACLRELNEEQRADANRYWLLATLGEAALILGQWQEAEGFYARASAAGRGRFAELNSTRRNARLIIGATGGDPALFERHFQIPSVVVFAGHMIDRPGRAAARFPPELERRVHEAIRDRLKRLNAGVGYASAACGSDLMFLETLEEMGGEAHVVLPYNQKQFMEDSVELIPGSDWGARCEQALRRATDVLVASEQRMEGGVPFEYTNLLLHGLASIRAEQLETRMIPLVVWDGKEGDGLGGTASIVKHWREMGHEVEVIDLARILREECPELSNSSSSSGPAAQTQSQTQATEEPAQEFATQMIAILFADAVNFSRLTEDELPRFVTHFLGTIGELASTSRHAPVMKNTWGDGLYFVFRSVLDAGQFALELCERVGRAKWVEKGLPKDLNLRIALHAGPVYSCIDPVTRQPNYIGTHVSRAARIEPITPPGQVYASQAFAALAAAQHVTGFTCDYVGQTPLAKGYGVFPTYHVRPRTSQK
ncbi:MAG TPA: TRAFs-binding domain-containing protein [Pyrinomonadaceae bacterium]|nr:TRAFs-binding domain-containing protein [Pyrinomonadaceae bacterium]